jgi:pimeloyl-ACP methyl ester carboxylesterase
MRHGATAILTACVLTLVGCSNRFLARRVVAPPNELRQKLTGPLAPIDNPTDGHLRIAVGPPKATLSAWVREPEKGATPRGTILILHGFLAEHAWLGYADDAFHEAGYRTVLVDLRGHGESTGKHITFGVVESRDLVQLTDYLQRNHLCGDHIGVYGVSMGASTAIEFAAIDRRVTAVVAVSPFASFVDEVPHFGRTLLPFPGAFLSKSDYAAIIARAAEIAQFDPRDASPLNAINKTRAPILLLHGDKDAIIPYASSRKLHDAAPDHSELVILPNEGHVGACFDFSGDARKRGADWFDRYLATPAVAASSVPANALPDAKASAAPQSR